MEDTQVSVSNPKICAPASGSRWTDRIAVTGTSCAIVILKFTSADGIGPFRRRRPPPPPVSCERWLLPRWTLGGHRACPLY